ncbi:YxiG-like protein [Nonomuraea dietziae]|uniref:YxiG-like protein n=1 Tax=Nonomuraea dietziae TaxID=65515 RepID=UPI00343525F9
MNPVKLQQALDDIFDQALLHHGFVDYMRDYQLVIRTTADPRTGIEPTTLRYLFRHCVQATCTTTVPAAIWRTSLDDRLITYETGVDLDGYVWGVNWQMLYPGATLITDSPTARSWAAAIGIDFHEVRIETNAHDLTLVFSDLHIDELPTESQRPEHKFPIQ